MNEKILEVLFEGFVVDDKIKALDDYMQQADHSLPSLVGDCFLAKYNKKEIVHLLISELQLDGDTLIDLTERFDSVLNRNFFILSALAYLEPDMVLETDHVIGSTILKVFNKDYDRNALNNFLIAKK